MSFLKKDQRKLCYASRDQYWSCMDEYEGKDEKIIHDKCKEFQELFIKDCPAQWVTHFDRKYKYIKFKQLMNTGYDPINDESIHKASGQQEQTQKNKV